MVGVSSLNGGDAGHVAEVMGHSLYAFVGSLAISWCGSVASLFLMFYVHRAAQRERYTRRLAEVTPASEA